MKTCLTRILFIVMTVFLSACASVTSTVKADSTPAADAGYIVGLFTKNKSAGVGLGIVNTASGYEYLLPFGEDTSWPSAKANEFSMIKVPPGDYRIKYWATYATLTKEIFAKSEIKDAPISSTFKVEANSVAFVGSYSIVQEWAPMPVGGWKFIWNLRQEPIAQKEASDRFSKAYGGYSQSSFSCFMCSN